MPCRKSYVSVLFERSVMYLSESIVWPSDATALRQMCLQVLAHQAPQLLAYQNELSLTEYEWIRRPDVIHRSAVRGRDALVLQ